MVMRRGSVYAALTTALLLLSIGNSSQAEEPVRGGILKVGFLSDTKTLDPVSSVQWTERQILFLLYDSLINANPDFSLRPGLAQSWSFEDGGKRIILNLRKGVVFHDGTPFNAAAVKWNFDTRMDPARNSSQRAQLASVVSSVEVVDDSTVAINMKLAYPPMLAMLTDRAGLMVSPTAAKASGRDFGGMPVGTGPFKFKQWVRGNHLSLVRNDSYWESGHPYLDGIVFNDIPSNVLGIQRLIVEELDYVGQLAPLDTRLAKQSQDIALVPMVSNWYSLQWRLDVAPYNNPVFRQALAYALNRERINKILWEGTAQISNGITPKGLWWEPGELSDISYDPAKAKELLAKSGVSPDVTLNLAAPSGEIMRRLAELAKEDFEAIGVKVQLVPVPQGEFYPKTVSGEIKFTPMRWAQRSDPDGFIQFVFATKGAANSTGYSNPQVDEWIAQARGTADLAVRKSLYDKIQMQISLDLPYLPIGFGSEYIAMRSLVHGFIPMPDLIPRFRDMWKTSK